MSRHYEVERSQVGALSVTIEYDPDPPNPRVDYDNLGTILYCSDRYTLGDKKVDPEEIRAVTRSDALWLPVYAYIHSGIRLSTGAFGCKWDSGQSGIIYVERARVLEEYSVRRVSPKTRKTALGVLEAEIETFSDFLEGQVYGYVIKDEDGEELESCWGIYGLDYCRDEAKSEAEALLKPKEPVKPKINRNLLI